MSNIQKITKWALLILSISVFTLSISVFTLSIIAVRQARLNHTQSALSSFQAGNIAELNRIVEKQGAMIDWHGRRITQLERPNEPVFPPRNPGRIGSIDSSEISSDK